SNHELLSSLSSDPNRHNKCLKGAVQYYFQLIHRRAAAAIIFRAIDRRLLFLLVKYSLALRVVFHVYTTKRILEMGVFVSEFPYVILRVFRVKYRGQMYKLVRCNCGSAERT